MRSSRNVGGRLFLLSTAFWALFGCGGGSNPSVTSGPPLTGGISILDDAGTPLSGNLAAGSDLNLSATGLEANRALEVLIEGPGTAYRLPTGEMVQGYYRVSTDREGALPRIPLVEQPATGDYRIRVRYVGATSGTTMPLRVAPEAGRPDLRVGAVEGESFVRTRVIGVGQSVAVTGSGLPAGTFDVYVVRRDSTGNLGPTLTDVSGFVPDDSLPSERGLTGTAETVQVGSDGNLAVTEVWRNVETQALNETFEVVIDTDRDGTYDAQSDLRLSSTRESFRVVEAPDRDPNVDQDLVTDGASKQSNFQLNGKPWVGNVSAPTTSESVMVGAYMVNLNDVKTNGSELKDISGPGGTPQPEMRLRSAQDPFAMTQMPVAYPDLRRGEFALVLDLNGNGRLDLGTDYVDGLDGQPALTVDGVRTVQKWTVMVYVDADNDLEGNLLNDLDEMEMPTYLKSDGTSDVTVCVQFDRIPGNDNSNGDWTTTRRFVMATDKDAGTIHTEPVEDLGEQDMGNPDTLRSFIRWAKATAPADRYMLIINSHGNGPKSRDATSGSITRGIGFDFTSNFSMLTPAELSDVIRGTGGVDVLGFDACQMANLEVFAQLEGCTDYVVASELNFPATSYAYDKLLKNMVANPDMSPREVAIDIVETNRAQYAQKETVALSAYDMAETPGLVTSLNALCVLLLNDPAGDTLPALYYDNGAWPTLLLGRASGKLPGLLDFATEPSKSDADDLRDLDALLDALMESADWPMVGNLAGYAKVSHEAARIASLISPQREKTHHGLSIWLPDASEYQTHKSAYRQLSMSRETLWDDLIEKVLKAKHVVEINGANTSGPYNGFHAFTVSEEVALDDDHSYLDGNPDGTFVGKGKYIIITDNPSEERRAMVLQLVYPTDWESPPRWRITTSGVSLVVRNASLQQEMTISTNGWYDREGILWNFWLPYWIGPDGKLESLDRRIYYGL